MNRYWKTLGFVIMLSGLVLGQQQGSLLRKGISSGMVKMALGPSWPVAAGFTIQEQEPEARAENKHLSKKEKKELKKRRKEEEKRRKKEAKNQEKQLKEQQKREAKERDKELKRENKQVATAQKKENARERKEEAKEIKTAEKREAHREREAVASAGTPPRMRKEPERYTIPVAYSAASGVLEAQRNVSRSIYSQMPSSHVIVLVNNANQLVLRGSAPGPSMKSRLLHLATAAAGGYGIVDQLAANAVGSAASGVTSAAIGGVSDLIHGSGSRQDNSGNYNGQQGPPPDNGAYGPPPGVYGPPPDNTQGNYGPPPDNGSSSYGPPSGGYGSNASAAEPYSASNGPSGNGLMQGSNACVNVYSNSQVLLTGQAGSQVDAERLLQFAQQLGGSNATVLNQLATRTNGTFQNAALVPEMIFDANRLSSMVTAGSVVCVNVDNANAMLLTGTVGSPAELTKVEQTMQPLLGTSRLMDQLTTGTLRASRPNADTSAENNPPLSPRDNAQGPAAASQVEQALHSIPELSNVDAEVVASEVRLSGSVDTPEAERVAREIAQQYAPGRSIVDNLSVTKREQAVQ